MPGAKPPFLPALRSLANACADELRLPRPPRMHLTRRGGELRLRAGAVTAVGHVGAVSLLLGELVVHAAGRAVLGQRTVWKGAADLWWKRPSAMFALAEACRARGLVPDARDLAYLAIVETLYLEDVAAGEKPAPPAAVSALVRGATSPLAKESGAHLSVVRRLVARLERAGRAEQLPLLRALCDVVGDASYANPLVMSELVAAPALARVRRHRDARREAALALVEALAGQLFLSAAYAETLPLLDALVDAGLELPRPLFDRFVARAALADPRAEEDRVRLAALVAAYPEKIRPHLAELAPWAALAHAHVRAASALLVRAAGGDPCRERSKRATPALSRGDAERLRAVAREHVEHARALLGPSLTADVDATDFDGIQRRKQIHEDFHRVDGELHRARGDTRAALAAFVSAHEAAQRDAYDHRKKAHVATLRTLAKTIGVPSPA